MNRQNATLLVIDGVVNLALGILLLLFPLGIPRWLGIPGGGTHFYPTLLGGVLFGIGLALLIERYGARHGIRGLGLGGAVAINLCGALVLLVWLLQDPFDLPLRGYLILWAVAGLVLLVGGVELISRAWRE